jgi:YesN/AraC family two-component response regulator
MSQPFLKQLESIINNQIHLIDTKKHILHIPQSGDAYIAGNKWHFHPTPELFIQVSGVSCMQSTSETILCHSEEILLIPKTISHYEQVQPDKNKFRNIVIAFGRETISFHEAIQGSTKYPVITELEQFISYNVAEIYHYLDTIVMLQQNISPYINNAIRGLLLTVFSLLLNDIQNPAMHQRNESYKIAHCRRMISEHLTNPELNVIWLANHISCAPDYLSHLFHIETGCRLTQHINDKRIDFAEELLADSSLNIAEIARACGYQDPGYMTRQFKKRNGKSPRNYRKNKF